MTQWIGKQRKNLLGGATGVIAKVVTVVQPPDCEKLFLFSKLPKVHPTTLLFSIESGNVLWQLEPGVSQAHSKFVRSHGPFHVENASRHRSTSTSQLDTKLWIIECCILLSDYIYDVNLKKNYVLWLESGLREPAHYPVPSASCSNTLQLAYTAWLGYSCYH